MCKESLKSKKDLNNLEHHIDGARGIVQSTQISHICDLCGEWADKLFLGSCEPCSIKYNILPTT